MKYDYATIQELNNLLKTKQITSEELTADFIKTAEATEAANFLTTLPKKEALNQAKAIDKAGNFTNLLSGIPYLAKDNFATKGIRTTAGSAILKNFIPPYDSTIVNLLNHEGAIMAGKASLDELAMGGTGLHSAFGPIHNPYDAKRMIGGSSSGSAYAVAMGYVPYATGTDTGDSIRKPASYAGVVGFKPTYGALSRYGIIPYAPSLDHAGFFTRNVEDQAILADATFRFDPKDFTSQSIPNHGFLNELNNLPKGTTFGYIKVIQDNLEADLKKAYEKFYDELKKRGYQVRELNFPKYLLEAVPSAYMMISFPEAVSTHSDLTGIGFGERIDANDYESVMRQSRSKYLGPVVKRRFLIGSLNLKKENQEIYIKKAKKVRRLIVDKLAELFNEVDILILPSASGVPPLIAEATDYETDHDADNEFINDVLVLANFNGMPSISLPFHYQNGLPIGISLNAPPKEDLLVLQAAQMVEKFLGYKNHRLLQKEKSLNHNKGENHAR